MRQNAFVERPLVPISTYRNGKWYDKKTGEEVRLASKADSWKTAGKFYITKDIEGYTCPVTNKWVSSRAAHAENLKRTGCRLLEPGEREQYERDKPREIERSAEKAADFLSDRIAERWDA